MQVRRMFAALMAVMLVSASAVAQERRYAGAGGPIPEGTQVEIRIIDNISSETAREGGRYETLTRFPQPGNGKMPSW
jgi:hypothetical protein